MSNEHAAITNHAPPGPSPSLEEKSSNKPPITMFGIAKIVSLVLAVLALIYLYHQGILTHENLKQVAAALPAIVFLPVYFLLPLIGFPINVLLLASGMTMGLWPSIALAFFGMGFHTFAAWYLAHSFLRGRLEDWLSNKGFEMPRIPENHQVWFTAVFVTIPGLPYAIKLYSLALTNLPFWRYFLIVWLVHLANGIIVIAVGVAAIHVDAAWLILLGVLALVTIVATNWLKNWYARRLEEEDSHKPEPESAPEQTEA